MHQIEVKLWEKRDKNGDSFLIGDAKGIPALVDLRDATFLVFYPPEESDDADGSFPCGTLIIRGERKTGPISNER